MRVHRSAFKHGLPVDTIQNIYDHPIVVIDLDPDSDPPKILIIHAMPLRPTFHRFLPDPTE